MLNVLISPSPVPEDNKFVSNKSAKRVGHRL